MTSSPAPLARALILVLLAALAASARAQAPETIHGENSEFRSPTVRLVWGVLRGSTEETTQVVIRVIDSADTYAQVRVDGVDPFTKARTTQVPLQPLGRQVDAAIPRARFAAHPSTEVVLFRTAADAQANRPALVVYYLGVPDTAPEFADRAALEAHLARMAEK